MANTRTWVGSKLEDLLLLTPKQLAKKYDISPQYASVHKYRVTKRIIKRMQRMEQDPNYQPTPEQLDEVDRVRELLKDFQENGIPVSEEDATRVREMKLWQTAAFDRETNDWNITTNRGVTLGMSKEEMEQDVIRQAPPVIIKPARVTRSKSKDRRCIVVPDLQGGYRRHGDELEPIHNESVVDVGLQIIRHAQPDLVILNGDNLDFPDLSHYAPDSNNFQQVMQATIDRVYEILATMRASAPDADIVWLAGNHEQRLNKQILQHNMSLWGVKRPGETVSWLSVAHLLNLEEIGVKYVSGYPANRFLINDRLQAIHGSKVRSNASTAALYSKEEELSTIFGHVHRLEQHSRTNRLGRVITALSFGTWARTDGAVPSWGNGVDDEGRVVPMQENWQNGMGFIEYQDGDKPFQWQQIHIDGEEDYETRFDGKIFRPKET